MDLGIRGKKAIVCASSKGLGKGCAAALAEAGCDLAINGRDADLLARTAEELRSKWGVTVVEVAGDVSRPEVQEALTGAFPQVDILVNNNGGPPFRDFRDVTREDMLRGVTNNMIAPIEMVQRVISGMTQRRFGRILNITSGSVKMPLGGLDLSSGARLGLTGFLAGVARQVAHANVTINNLLPGAFDTRRLQSGQQASAEQRGINIDEVRAERAAAIPARRFGDPSEFAAACAFLCSAQAGYITGQSLLIDGGAFPGVM